MKGGGSNGQMIVKKVLLILFLSRFINVLEDNVIERKSYHENS